MLTMIDNSSIHVSQAVQLAINAAAMHRRLRLHRTLPRHIHQLPVHVPRILSRRLPARRRATTSAGSGACGGSSGSVDLRLVMGGSLHLTSRTLFAQTRIRCEDVLFELIDRKIDDFLSALHSPDLTPAAIALEPSDYITDLTSYLDSTFASLSHIAPSVRDTLYFTSARHIASSLAAYLPHHTQALQHAGAVQLQPGPADTGELGQTVPRQRAGGVLQRVQTAHGRRAESGRGRPGRCGKRERELPHLSAAKLVRAAGQVQRPAQLSSQGARAAESE